MKEDKNDMLLDEFFSHARQTEIPDNGFSDSVMQSIDALGDKRLERLSRIWTAVCTLLGAAFVIFSAAKAGFHIYSAKEIASLIISHFARMMHGILTLNPADIPQYVYAIPLLVTILLAILIIKKEGRQTVLY